MARTTYPNNPASADADRFAATIEAKAAEIAAERRAGLPPLLDHPAVHDAIARLQGECGDVLSAGAAR